MRMECNVILDLLPLYVDEICSKESRYLVEEHLKECENCQKVYENMKSNIEMIQYSTAVENKKMFQRAWKNILGIVLALAVILSGFAVNLSGALYGGPANIGEFIATLLYIVFWGIFTVVTREYRPFVKLSFVMSLLTLISSASSLLFRFVDGFIVALLLSVFASVPFYGLRLCMGWTEVYFTVTVISFLWFGYTWKNRKKCTK